MGFVGLSTEDAQCNCYVERFVRAVGNVSGNPGQGSYDRGFVQLASLFLKGKILYTPDNNITRNIISQVSPEELCVEKEKQRNQFELKNKQHHRKVMLNGFHFI